PHLTIRATTPQPSGPLGEAAMPCPSPAIESPRLPSLPGLTSSLAWDLYGQEGRRWEMPTNDQARRVAPLATGSAGRNASWFLLAGVALGLLLATPIIACAFDVLRYEEATIADIHAAFKAKTLTCRTLVQMYLDRIEAYDKKGPALNAIVVTNPEAL